MKKVLITGANGFIGRHLTQHLDDVEVPYIAVVRDPLSAPNGNQISIDLLADSAVWQSWLKDVDVVVHLAARAHVLNEKADDPRHEYKNINVDLSIHLAQQAAKHSVRRFIFLSSIGVNGNQSDSPYNEYSKTNPEELYAQSKQMAEQALIQLASTSNFELVIIRPPLVYGPNAKGNVSKLIRICTRSIPLPFGAIHNKRSMIYIENLVDFIATCISHPKAANETFLISDDEDISTTHLISSIRQASGTSVWLIPIPQRWVVFLLKLIGKQSLATRLCGNLQVDISKAKTLLGWKPPYSFKQGIQKTIQNN